MVEKISNAARPKAGIKIIENLGAFFGERFIGELTGTLQRDYASNADHRALPAATWKPWLRPSITTSKTWSVGQHAVSPGAAGCVASPRTVADTR